MKPIVLRGHSRPIKDIKFNMVGDMLFTGSVDRLISLWTIETGEQIGTFTQRAAVSNFCVTKDSRLMISGDTTGTIYLWDINSGKKIREFEGDPTLSIKSIDLSQDDEKVSFVISGRQKKSKSFVEIYNIVDLLGLSNTETLNKSVDSKIESSTDKFTSAKFSTINKKLYISKEDGSMDIFDINDKSIVITKKLHDDTIMDFDFSPMHEFIITASKDGNAHLINSIDLKILNTIKPEKPTRCLNACKFYPLFSLKDENKSKYNAIIAGGQESKDVTITHTNAGGFEVIFYNSISNEKIGCIEGHFGPVNSLAFSADGNYLASGGEDATVRIYRLSDEIFNK